MSDETNGTSTLPSPPPSGFPESDESGETIDARRALIAIARAELGEQDPDKYWRVVQPKLCGSPHKIAWCGGFVLWCLHEARFCDWTWDIWEGPGTKSGFLYRLKQTHMPEPGDIAYFHQGQHHALVESWVPGILKTIDGNSMVSPLEGVTAKTRFSPLGVDYYSIASLISD